MIFPPDNNCAHGKQFKPAGWNNIFIVIITLLVILGISVNFLSCGGPDSKSSHLQEYTVMLGRYLFYDRRLSINNTRSCGTCHNPQFAFTDGYKRSLGAFADLHQRNTQPLFNLSYLKYFTAADSTLHSPLQQINNPLFNKHPVEMGASGNEAPIMQRIVSDKVYREMFDNAGMNISWVSIKTAIGSFMTTIYSANSPYDKFIQGDSNALNESQKKGMALFFSNRLKCASCHAGFNFSTPTLINERGDSLFFFNMGHYDIDGKGSYPEYDQGLYQLTRNKEDMGKFRVPTLRNLAFTAPFLHDGSADGLDDVIDSYINGGRNIKEGVHKGNGVMNIYKHPFVTGFNIPETGKADLINFLLGLSDSSFINDPSIQNPFTEDETKRSINLQHLK